MPQNLRDLFERVLDDEPVPPPGDLTRQAMNQGRRIRRRRGLVAAGTAAAVAGAAMVVLNVALPPAEPPPTVSAAVALMTREEPTCAWSARDRATDVSIFLTTDITEAQRDDLEAALRADPLVRNLLFESKDAAYQKFKILWRDSPDFVASVGADSLPESFRFELARPADFPAFAAGLRSRAGVQDLVGGTCP